MVMNAPCCTKPGIILCMRPVNERWCYSVTPSLIGWAHTQNDPCQTLPTATSRRWELYGYKKVDIPLVIIALDNELKHSWHQAIISFIIHHTLIRNWLICVQINMQFSIMCLTILCFFHWLPYNMQSIHYFFLFFIFLTRVPMIMVQP